MSSGVSASLSSRCLHVVGSSLGEMRYHYVAGTSGWDFNKVMSTNFWSHDDGSLDTDGKALRNLSVLRHKTITKLLAGEEEKNLLKKLGSLILIYRECVV